MENIKISKICGLCAGCQNAINVSNSELQKGNNVTIFKEIVHNKNVNQNLISAGAVFAENLEDLKTGSVVILRAHGEPPETYDYLNKNKITFKDCTCPRVAKIHEQVEKYSNEGYLIVLLGKHKKALHPEVLGTIGWSKTNSFLIESVEDLNQLENIKNKKLYLVCQTTFNIKKADELISKIEQISKSNNCELVINKSICDAQKLINTHSAELAANSDIMIVVGGKNSSNSLELFTHMQTICPSIFIEDISDYKSALENANLTISKTTKVGITAGASTNKQELEDLKQLIISDLGE